MYGGELILGQDPCNQTTMDIADLLHRMLSYVLDTKQQNLMLFLDHNYDWRSRGVSATTWRDVNNLMRLDPEVNKFYDYVIDPLERYRSHFSLENCFWALNTDWASSPEFIKNFTQLYEITVPADRYKAHETHLLQKGLKKHLGLTTFTGFPMVPSVSNTLYDTKILLLTDTDAILAKVWEEQVQTDKIKE